MNAIPNVEKKRDRLNSIKGSVPNLISPPSGCRFHPRCEHAMKICSEKVPELYEESNGHTVACWLYGGAK
jgi:peptide/nickel transport system ATP-binding protein